MYEWQGIVATVLRVLGFFLNVFLQMFLNFVLLFQYIIQHCGQHCCFIMLYKWIGLLKTLIIGPAFSDLNDKLIEEKKTVLWEKRFTV